MKNLFNTTLFTVLLTWMSTLWATSVFNPYDASEYLEAPFYSHSQEPHHFTFLKTGPIALQARLDLIQSAQESIEFEYFVFKVDKAGRLLLQALAERARDGIDVKIMFDHFGSFTEVSKYLVEELVESGVEFKAYNQNILNAYLAQFRNHRKMIVVDGEVALTGGRNVSKRYFGVSEDYNLSDRDFILRGPIVSDIRESFYEYWNSEVAEPRDLPRRRRGFLRRLRMAKAQDTMTQRKDDDRFIQELEEFVRDDLKDLPQATCRNITYVTDRPIIGRDGMQPYSRLARSVVADRILNAQDRVYIESPYIVFDREKEVIFQQVLDRGARLTLKSNSLKATNVFPVTAVFYKHLMPWFEKGLDAYIFKGEELAHHRSFPGMNDADWGIHSKAMLFDDDEVMLGSFNFDPRTTVWNTEYAIFCKDQEVASIIQESVDKRLDHSFHLTHKDDISEYGFEGTTFWQRILYSTIRHPSDWISFLL